MKPAIFILALLITRGVHAENRTPQMSVDEAKRHAVEHNFEIVALRRELEEKAAAAGVATSFYYPKLGVAGGTELRRGTAVPMAYAYGTMNFFRGFDDSNRSSIASIEADKASLRLKQAEFRIGLDVEEAFYRYLSLRTSMELKKQALDSNINLKKTAAKRRAGGLAAESDVMEFDLREALLRSDLASLEQDIESARVELKRLLGEEMGAVVEPTGKTQHFHLKGELKGYLERIPRENEAVRLASKDVERASVESRRWLSRWLPTIDARVEAGYLDFEGRPANGGPGVRGIALAKIDLFSGFDSVHQRREGIAQQLKFEAQAKQARVLAEAKVETAYRKVKAIEARVHLEEDNQSRAQRYYKSVLSEYQRGVKNSADMKSAADGVLEASLRAENFKYQFLAHKVELERALDGVVEIEPASSTAHHSR